MFFVCLLTMTYENKVTYQNCGMHSEEYLERAKAACDLAQHDPVGSCEVLHTSDGNRWWFIHGGVK